MPVPWMVREMMFLILFDPASAGDSTCWNCFGCSWSHGGEGPRFGGFWRELWLQNPALSCIIHMFPCFFFRRQKYLESYPEFRIQGWQWTNSLPASVLRWLGVSDLYLRHLCVHITVTANHWPRKRIVAQVTNWLAHGFIGAVLSIVFFKLSITIFGLEEESFFSKFFAPKRGDSTYWYLFTGQGYLRYLRLIFDFLWIPIPRNPIFLL